MIPQLQPLFGSAYISDQNSAASAIIPIWHVDKIPRLTAKDLKTNLAQGGTDVAVDTVRHILHTDELNAQNPKTLTVAELTDQEKTTPVCSNQPAIATDVLERFSMV